MGTRKSKLILAIVAFTLIFNLNTEIKADAGFSNYGRLAYEVDHGSDSDIYVWDVDTDWEKGRKWLVRLDGINEMDECNLMQPSLSKYGEWLAFSTDCDYYGKNPDFKNWIAIVNLENLNEWYPLTAGINNNISFNANNPTWDPTGSKIAFDSDLLGDGNRYIFSINVYDQIDASASGKIAPITQIYGDQAYDPDYPFDGDFLAAKTPDGIKRIWSDGNASVISNFPGNVPGDIAGGIAIRSNYGKHEEQDRITDFWEMIDCDPRAEVFAFHSPNAIDYENSVDDGSSRIIVTCEHGIDEKTPKNIQSNNDFATYISSNGGKNCCIGFFPEASPGGRGLIYIQQTGQIMAKKFENGNYSSAHFKDTPEVSVGNNFSRLWSPISWSHANNPLKVEEGIEIGVGAIGLSVDVGGGVNNIFKQEDSLEDQFDRQVQLEIDRINSYIAELEFTRETNLRLLQFDIDSFMQNHNSYIEREQARIFDEEYRWEFQINDIKNQLEFELEYFDEQTEFEYANQKSQIENFSQGGTSFQIQELEAQYNFDIEQTKAFHQEELQRFEFDYQIRVSDINRNWDDELIYNDQYYNDEIANAQNEGDNSYIEFLMEEKQSSRESIEFTRNRELDDAYNEYQFRVFDQLDWESNDLRNREIDYQNTLANLERDMSRELQNRETNLINYTNQREIEREDIKSRFMFDIQSQEMQRDQNISMVRQQVDMNLQQESFNLEREEMNWDLRRQQIQLDYENQLKDFQSQIEQVKFQAEIDKERLSMDKAQYEAEMIQLQNEIQSRETDAERFYDDSLAQLTIEANNRAEELENRRIDENWSDERYQQELADYDKWYSDRTYEIQSNYDSRIREIEFDQRQYENLQTVVETNELYQEGERGFFGNPIPGTVRQGGFTDDLSDPGNLAMLGIVITVGTTLLQLARGK